MGGRVKKKGKRETGRGKKGQNKVRERKGKT